MENKLKDIKIKSTTKSNGITLIALVITIVVLLILAGVSIAMLTGNNGIINKTSEAQFKSDLSNFKEQLEIFKISKTMENKNFLEDTLNAGTAENTLQYNTKPAEETGNIEKIINNIDNKYKGKVEIIKGQLIYNTQSKQEIKWIQDLGLEANPYEINNGELVSSNGNLLLMDSTGTVTIPSTVTSIGEGAFANLSGLKTVIIPGSVKEIKANAFSNNKTLENVILLDGVEKIGVSCFKECVNLKSIKMPNSIKKIGEGAFWSCTSLEEISIPEKIERIESNTFIFCFNLKNVIFLGNNVQTIGYQAFGSCRSLKSFEITKNVSEIEARAFAEDEILENININSENKCFEYNQGMLMKKDKSNILFVSNMYLQNITTFSIPEGITEFDVSISAGKNIKTLNIPSTLTILKTVGLPNSIENVNISQENEIFKVEENCIYTKDNENLIYCYSKDKNIILKNQFKIVNTDSFSGTAGVESITFPESVTTIKMRPFVYCTKLQTLNIGKNVSNINGQFRTNTNRDLTINIDNENPYYMVENNILYSRNKESIVAVLYEVKGVFNVPDQVKKIETQAFGEQSEMTEINLNKIESMGGSIFSGCTKLTKVKIPNTVKEINDKCFEGNSEINEIKINLKENSISGAPFGAVKGMKVIKWQE